MHLIELGKGNYSLIADMKPGTTSLHIRPGAHGCPVGMYDVELVPGVQPGDTVIEFSDKENLEGVIEFLQRMADRIDPAPVNGCCGQDPCLDEPGDEDCGYRGECRGKASAPAFEAPAHATGSDDEGEYRLIVLQSMPEDWSHLRMHKDGDVVIVNKDLSEREPNSFELVRIYIAVQACRWSFIEQPAKSEYPKYVIDRHLWDDVAYIEQAGPTEWTCVLKYGERTEMWPGITVSHKTDLFDRFIEQGVWNYVSEAEAKSRLEK